MTRVLSIVGKSKRGKTTLLKQLISLLKERGYTVCVIKHSDKNLSYKDFDHKGKDTYAFSEAGADEIWLTSPSVTYHLNPGETLLREMIDATRADFVFTEGFKHADTEKIVLKTRGEDIAVKGKILAVLEGEYDSEEVLKLLICS